MITPCIFGEAISTQNKQILSRLINFPWFKMTRGKQKIFLQYLHLAQTAKKFFIPIFGYVVDIEAFADVMNVSYTYFTFFQHFMD